MTFLTDQVIAYVTFVLPIWVPLLVVDVLALIVLIFVERLDPRSLIFWITVIVILPFAGIVLFALFGSTIYASRRFGRKSAEDQKFLDYIIPQEGEETVMQRSLRELGADVRTKGNLVKLYWERSEILADVRADFDSATESIYIMARRMPHGLDEAMRSLIEKTKQGLDVRIMTSTLWFGRTGGIGKLRKAGAKFCTFHNPLYSAFMKKSAYRNMRSFVVIDGAIAYEGRGAAMRLEGPAAERLERRFRADWLHGSGEDLGVRPVSTPPRQGGVDVQIVSDGPDLRESSPMMTCYSDIIGGARESLYMSFPYLMPNDELYASVKLAVLSGVDVRILLPRRSRRWYQAWNSLAAAYPLMLAGARVYFADRSLAKCIMVADRSTLSIGSSDFTTRSLDLDFNTNATVYSSEAASEAADAILHETGLAAECHPEDYESRSIADMFNIAVSRMLMFFN